MFDLHQDIEDEDGNQDEEVVRNYCDKLMEAFLEAPEGVACHEQFGQLGWARSFLDYGFNHIGNSPSQMSLGDVQEILFELFPAKVSVQPDRAGAIVGEIRAFWQFLGREYQLPAAAEIVEDLGKDAELEMHELLSDPDNFGMAKSIFMMGQAAGFDVTTQAGMEEFMATYNAMIQDNRAIEQANSSAASNQVPRYSPPQPHAKPRIQVILSREERKAREKLRKKKIGRSKGR